MTGMFNCDAQVSASRTRGKHEVADKTIRGACDDYTLAFRCRHLRRQIRRSLLHFTYIILRSVTATAIAGMHDIDEFFQPVRHHEILLNSGLTSLAQLGWHAGATYDSLPAAATAEYVRP
jgi:hypothetical protein